jgi:hypothetical protein
MECVFIAMFDFLMEMIIDKFMHLIYKVYDNRIIVNDDNNNEVCCTC